MQPFWAAPLWFFYYRLFTCTVVGKPCVVKENIFHVGHKVVAYNFFIGDFFPEKLIISVLFCLALFFKYTVIKINIREFAVFASVKGGELKTSALNASEVYLSDIFASDAGAGAWQKKMLEIILREIIILTERKETAARNKSHDMIVRYIRENYQKNISLACISQNFGLSKSYISRLFKRKELCTVSQYITRVRLSKACNLPCNSTLSVKEIAEKCGYESQYYFSRVFKKNFNTTPTSFKEENKI